MPLYFYKAMADHGVLFTGQYQGDSPYALAQHLREKGLWLIQSKAHKKPLFAKRLSLDLQIDFCVFLTQLSAVGVPLWEALDDLLMATNSPLLKYVVVILRQDMEEGLSLSEAMKKQKTPFFDSLMETMIAVGEQTGNMASVLQNFEQYLRWQQTLQAQFRKNIRYPLCVLVLMSIMLAVFASLLLPNVESFFKTMGITEVPFLTRSLFAFISFWSTSGHWMALLSAVSFVAYRYRPLSMKEKFCLRFHQQWLLAHFLQGFALMIRVGHDALSAIHLATSVAHHPWLKKRLEMISTQLLGGESLSVALSQTLPLPAVIHRMMVLGESSGNLAALLEMAVTAHRVSLEKRSEAIAFWIGPCLMVFSGALILWMIGAIMLPLYTQLGALDW